MGVKLALLEYDMGVPFYVGNEQFSTKMRGGYLRFQAQYLRRIRVPRWKEIPGDARRALKDAATKRDRAACDEAAAAVYGLSPAERAALMVT